MIPISRADAANNGYPKFFTGKPCKAGHVAERYVSTGGCVACLRQYSSKFAPRREGGTVAVPAQNIHPSELDTYYAFVDYLNSKHGLRPAVRSGVVSVAPTQWELYLAKEMKKAPNIRPSLASIRHAANRLGIPEAYAATQGAPVDDWSATAEQAARERDLRLSQFAAELERQGYGNT